MNCRLLFFAILCIPAIVCAEPVKIGVLTDLSGGMAAWGKQTVLGSEIARDEILANGGQIVLTFGDHQLQAKNAVAEFQKLTEFHTSDRRLILPKDSLRDCKSVRLTLLYGPI